MKILMADGHQTFSGTPVQIVTKMRRLYNRWKENPLNSNGEYMLGVIERMGYGPNIGQGHLSEEEKCESFVRFLINEGMAKVIVE